MHQYAIFHNNNGIMKLFQTWEIKLISIIFREKAQKKWKLRDVHNITRIAALRHMTKWYVHLYSIFYNDIGTVQLFWTWVVELISIIFREKAQKTEQRAQQWAFSSAPKTLLNHTHTLSKLHFLELKKPFFGLQQKLMVT